MTNIYIEDKRNIEFYAYLAMFYCDFMLAENEKIKPICIPEASENSWAETTKKVNISKKH